MLQFKFLNDVSNVTTFGGAIPLTVATPPATALEAVGPPIPGGPCGLWGPLGPCGHCGPCTPGTPCGPIHPLHPL